MFKIKEKNRNKAVNIMINGIETDYTFGIGYDLDENTQEILTSAGYEIEAIVEITKEVQ